MVVVSVETLGISLGPEIVVETVGVETEGSGMEMVGTV